MNFIHKTFFFSGYDNVCCVFWVCNWLNCNFHARPVKNFYVNFRNWSNDGAFRNNRYCFGFRTRARTRIFSTQRSNCSPSVVCVRSNILLISGDHKMLDEGLFTELCKLYLLFQGLEVRCASLRPVSSRLGRTRYQQFHFFWLHHGQIFIVHMNKDSSFFSFCQGELITPIRNCSAKIPSWLTEWTVWNKSSVSPLKWIVHLPPSRVQDSKNWCFWRQDDQSLWIADSIVLFDRGNRHTTFLPIPDPKVSNVFATTSSCDSWLSSAFEMRFSSFFFHTMSLNIVHEDDPWCLLAWCSLSPTRSGSRSKSIGFSVESHCVLIRPNTSWDLQLGLSIFLLLLKNIFHLSDTKNGISVDTYFCLRSLDRLMIGKYWPRATTVMNSRHSTFRMSSQCSFINFRVSLNTLQIFFNFVFL